MDVKFTRQFGKDIGRLPDANLAISIERIILSTKSAHNLSGINNLKKLKGYKNAYRIRIGDYRIGVFIEGNVVEFCCCMKRSDIYKYFP